MFRVPQEEAYLLSLLVANTCVGGLLSLFLLTLGFLAVQVDVAIPFLTSMAVHIVLACANATLVGCCLEPRMPCYRNPVCRALSCAAIAVHACAALTVLFYVVGQQNASGW